MYLYFTAAQNLAPEVDPTEIPNKENDDSSITPPSIPVQQHAWRSLKLTRVTKKRGRPKGDKSAFSSFHK